MKKLKLNLGGVKETLTREQMKKISGGYDVKSCEWLDCPPGSLYYCTVPDGGTCQIDHHWYPTGHYYTCDPENPSICVLVN